MIRAAEAARVSHIYVYKVRKKSPRFAEAWDRALEIGTEELEKARRRGLATSDTLLIFLLKGRRKDVFGDQGRYEMTQQVRGPKGAPI